MTKLPDANSRHVLFVAQVGQAGLSLVRRSQIRLEAGVQVGSVFKTWDIQTQVDRKGLPYRGPNPRVGDVLNSPTGLQGDPRS